MDNGAAASAVTAPLPSAKRRKLTVRTRLALSYAVLVMSCGAVLIAIVAGFMGLVPAYAFGGDQLQIEIIPGATFDPNATIRVETSADMIRVLLTVSGIALVLLGLITAGVAWLLAGRMLRPLAEVNTAAKRAAEGDLQHRIAASGPRDEISELADTFDAMLAEIERSVEAHRRFAANASHELRTPLATTRTMIDVARAVPEGADAELLTRLRELNERSIETVEALLDLAEIEAAAPENMTEAIDLRALIWGEAARVAELAQQRAVTIHPARSAPDPAQLGVARAVPGGASAEEPVQVRGSAVLLRQLVQNLLQNAVLHNVEGGSAVVAVERSGSDVVLRVENSGVQLTAAELDRLREPFARGEARVGGGRRGLGLSIVDAVVTKHGGTLTLRANAGGGLEVEVRLPAA